MNLIEHLGRTETSKMKAWELNAGFSLALGLPTRLAAGRSRRVEAYRNGEWRVFSPTTSWEDFGFAVSNFGIVMVTHGGEDGGPRWFSAHAYISGTSFDSTDDLRRAAAMSATAFGKQMDWRMVVSEPEVLTSSPP